MSKASNIFLIVCITVGAVFLSGLGFWQLNRLDWKEQLIARVHENLQKPPLTLAEIETELKNGREIEYRPVTVSGWFDHAKEQFFFATHNSKVGFFVYTPLLQANREYVFINRGFVLQDKKDASSRGAGQVEGEISITGLARSAPTEKPNSFVPDNDLAENIYYWKSLNEMGKNAFVDKEVKIAPVFVDADKTPNPGGMPAGGVTLIEFPNSHLQYALTWFGLAGTLLMVGGYFVWTRRKME